MTTPTKICTKCGKSFPATLEYFNQASKNKSGLYCHCRDCRAQYRRDNAVLLREQRIAERQRNADTYKAYAASGREAEKCRRYYSRNREQIIRQKIGYQKANPHIKRKSGARYYQRHKVEHDAQSRSYYTRKMKAPGKHTGADIKAQFALQGGLCYWCSEPVNESYDVDHIIPISKGGSNSPDNLAITCPTCNRKKNNKLPYIEWIPPNPLKF